MSVACTCSYVGCIQPERHGGPHILSGGIEVYEPEPAPKRLTFEGVVLLKEYVLSPGTNSQYRTIAGKVKIIHQDDLVGFKVKGNESNWVARVSGKTSAVTILGCQIRGFVELDSPLESSVDTWVVA